MPYLGNATYYLAKYLAQLLKSLDGSKCTVRNNEMFKKTKKKKKKNRKQKITKDYTMTPPAVVEML